MQPLQSSTTTSRRRRVYSPINNTLAIMVTVIAFVLMLTANAVVVTAFQGPVLLVQPMRSSSSRSWTTTTTTRTSKQNKNFGTALFLSDIPKDPDEERTRRQWQLRKKLKFDLPPPPEDQLILTGDLLSLFVYAFSDHFVSQDLASYLNTAAVNDGTALVAATSASGQTGDVVLSAPVWLDATSGYHDHVLNVILSDQTVTQYSPLLQPAGLAACLLSAAWLGCGWVHRAFAYKNTLDCSADKALTVTAKAWLTTCIILMAGVAVSNAMLLSSQPQDMEWWQTFKKGDVDYIWDSLSVLCLWRFIASSMLGSGGSDSSDDE